MQSPKSKRAKAPGETPSSDGNSTEKSGGVYSKPHGSDLARSKAHVPKSSPVGHAGAGRGYTPQPKLVPTHSEAPSQAGRPGYQSCNPCGTQRGKK